MSVSLALRDITEMATGTPTPWTHHISPPTLPTTRSAFPARDLPHKQFTRTLKFFFFYKIAFSRILRRPSIVCRVATPRCRPGLVTAPPLPPSSLTTPSSSTPASPRTRSRPHLGFLAPRPLRVAPGTGTWPTWAPCPGPSPRSSPGPPPRRSISCQAPATAGA